MLSRSDVAAAYETGRADLFRLAWLATGDAVAAEDLVHEAYTRVWERPELVRRPDRLDAYLRSIVLNLVRTDAATTKRRHRIDLRLTGGRDRQPDPASTSTLRVHVEDGLAALSPRQRTCIVGRYWLGLSDEELARATGMSAGTVKTHLRRALNRLRSTLDLDAPVEHPRPDEPAEEQHHGTRP